MSTKIYQFTCLSTVCSTVHSRTHQRKHRSSASLAFVRNPPVTGGFPSQRASSAEMFPFHDVITGHWFCHHITRDVVWTPWILLGCNPDVLELYPLLVEFFIGNTWYICIFRPFSSMIWHTWIPAQIAKTLGSTPIGYRSDVKLSDRYLIDVDQGSLLSVIMMTSSNGDIFRVTGPLCGELTGHRLIPLTKASDAEPWCFLWSAPE